MLVGDSKTVTGSSSSKQTDPFSNERLVGVRQQLPAEDAEPGRHSYSSRLINNKPNKLPMKVTRDDSRGFESESKLRTGASNYHSAVHLRQSKDFHNLSSSSKLLESPTKLPAIGTPSNRANLKVTWPSAKHSSAGYYETYKSLIESDITEMNAKDVETENMLLRNALKDMNDNLKQRVERVKQSEFIPKRPEFKDKNIDDQMRTLLKELENNEKLLAINEEEYKRLDAKVQQVSDPNYYYDLDKNVKDIYKQIEEMRRENKKLYITSSATGKNLDRIENITGIPVIMEEALAKEKEIVIVRHKVEDLKVKNETFKEEKHQKLLKNKKLTEQVKQLSQGKDFDDDAERLAIQYKSLQRKLKAVEDDLKLTKNKQKKFMETQKGRELEELFSQHLKDREHFETLDKMIAEQVAVMREMVKNQSGSRNRVIEQIVNNLTINLDKEEGARERTAQSFEESKNGVDKTYKSMLPSKGKFSSTQGLGIKGQMYDGLPLFSPETTKSKLIKTQSNKVAVRRELQDQKKPVWRDVDSKNVSKIDLTLIKTVEEKPHIAGYTPSEGLKKLQKALESGREEYQKSARGEKSGNNSPARSIGKMADSIDSSRVEKKEVFRNPKLGNLPNLKANEEPVENHHEQEHNIGLSKKRNHVKPLGLKSKPTEDEFDTEDILDHPDDIKGDHTSTDRQKKKQVGTSGILKSQANSRIPSANKNKSPELLNDDLDADIEYLPKKKNTHKLESLQNKKPTQDEPLSGESRKQDKSMKKKELLSQEPSFRNSPDVLEESARGKRETARKSQNLDLKLKKQESRSVSPGKRSDLTIDVDAIEKEHEGVFDFGDEEKKTPVHQEKSHRQRDEDEKPRKKTVKKEDVLDLDTKPNPRQTKPVEVAKKNSEDDMFDDAVDNRMKNLNRKNLDQKPKPAAIKKQEDDFEEFEFS